MKLFGLFEVTLKKKQQQQKKKKATSEWISQCGDTKGMPMSEARKYDEKQNQLLSRVNDAVAKYRENGDLQALIKEYEFAFIESKPPCNTSQNLDLARAYVKAGMNNKAWGYLNSLLVRNQAPEDKVRFEMARILKKEKKYKQAIETYMMGHRAKYGQLNRNVFFKDISSSANKLGLTDAQREELARMVEYGRNGGDMLRAYREHMEKWGIE